MSAKKTTKSTSYKYLTEYYVLGSFPVQIENHGPGDAKVKVVEVINDEYTIYPQECVTHTVSGFARVDYKSIDGTEMTVESKQGECPEILPFNEADKTLAPLTTNEQEQLSEEVRTKLKEMIETLRSKMKRLFED